MPLIEKFEDIVAWREARVLTHMVYGLVREGSLARDFALRDQLCRAAASAMTNIAEEFDCDSKLEFARFLGIARRSAVEVQSLLYIALDADHIDRATFDVYYAQAGKVKGLIGGLKHSLAK